MPLVATRSNAGVFGLGWGAPAGGAADAMTAIASTTLSTTASTVTFNSIPTTYDDLYLVGYRIGDSFNLRLNNDSGSNYSETLLYGDGSSATVTRITSQTQFSLLGDNGNTTTPGSFVVHINNYANTSNNKTIIVRAATDLNGVGGQTRSVSGLYRSTAAISRLDLIANGTFSANSVFALYGIKKAA